MKSLLSGALLIVSICTAVNTQGWSSSSSSNEQVKRCATLQPMPVFNLEKFTGVWHEAELLAYRGLIDHQRPFLHIHKKTKKYERKCGHKYPVKGSLSQVYGGELQVLINDVLIDLLVLESDYENYSVVCPCTYGLPSTDEVFVIPETVMVLTRQTNPTPQVLQQANDCLVQHNISTTNLVSSNPYQPLNVLLYVDKHE